MSTLIVIGSSNTDMVVQAAKLPAPGETVLGGTFLLNPGGKGANQAVAAARLGARVMLVAKVGNDVFGQQAILGFEREGIHTEFVSVDEDRPSGVALIGVDRHGENAIMVAPGANAHLHPAEVELALAAGQGQPWVLLQLEIPLATVEYAAREAHDRGWAVILNPAPAQPLPTSLFPYLYAITPNETEAEILTGIPVMDEPSAVAAAKVLHSLGVPRVIITLGARGALVSQPTGTVLLPAPVVQAVDTTAAGDVFNGALAVALAENRDLIESVRFAIRAAAISVTRLGAQASAPSRAEVD